MESRSIPKRKGKKKKQRVFGLRGVKHWFFRQAKNFWYAIWLRSWCIERRVLLSCAVVDILLVVSQILGHLLVDSAAMIQRMKTVNISKRLFRWQARKAGFEHKNPFVHWENCTVDFQYVQILYSAQRGMEGASSF